VCYAAPGWRHSRLHQQEKCHNLLTKRAFLAMGKG
jgi:hypothetical protein